ncbi:MAG: phage tail assembly protein [Devosia sp.]
MKMTVPLKYPFEHDGVTYSELTVRRAKLKDFEWIENLSRLAAEVDDNASFEIIAVTKAIAHLCDIPEEAAGEIDAIDFFPVRDATGFVEALSAISAGGPESPSAPTS